MPDEPVTGAEPEVQEDALDLSSAARNLLEDAVPPDPESLVETPPEPPAPAVTAEQWEETQRNLKTMEQRQGETRRAFDMAQQQSAELAALNQRLLAQAQEMERWSQQAAAAPEPQIDWESALSDEKALQEAVMATVRHAEGRVASYVQPVVQGQQHLQAASQQNQAFAREFAIERGRKEWEASGYDPEVYDEILPELRQHIERNGDAALATLSQPNGTSSVAVIIAHNKGLKFQDKAKSRAPVTSAVTSSVAGPGSPQVTPDIAAYHRQVSKSLGIDLGKLTPEELTELNSF